MIRIPKEPIKRALPWVSMTLIVGVFICALLYFPQFGILAERSIAIDIPVLEPTPAKEVTECYYGDDAYAYVTKEECESYYNGATDEPYEEPQQEVQAAQTYRQPTTPPLLDCGSGHLVTELSQCGKLGTGNPNFQKKQNSQGSNNSQLISVPCIVDGATYIQYGNTQEEANTRCNQLKEYSQSLIDSNNEALERFNQSTEAYDTPPEQPPQQINYVQQCRDTVTSKYEPLFQSCNAYGSGTRQSCIEIYSQQKNAEYKSCG